MLKIFNFGILTPLHGKPHLKKCIVLSQNIYCNSALLMGVLYRTEISFKVLYVILSTQKKSIKKSQ